MENDNESDFRHVYPVVIGLSTSANCPEGFTEENADKLFGSNYNGYISMNDNSLVMGGIYTWSQRGNYNRMSLTSSYVSKYCIKLYETQTVPSATFLSVKNKMCPNGYVSLDFSDVQYNNNAYISNTGTSLYVGPLQNYAGSDLESGYMLASTNGVSVDKICFKVQ